MARMISSLLDHNWERKLLMALVLLLFGLFFTWEVILEDAPSPVPRQFTLPTPPHLFQWEVSSPEFLMPNIGSYVNNPFLTQFPLEKPIAIEPPVQPPQAIKEEPKPEISSPAHPPKRTIVISFHGVRTALSGEIFAILEVSDSELGASTTYLKKDAILESGIKLEEVSETQIRLSNEKGEDIGTIPYGDTKIFTLDNKE